MISASRGRRTPRQTSGARAFARRFPDVWNRLSAITTPISRVVEDQGRVVNIDLGGAMLYPQPAPAWLETQLEAFRENPDRLGFANPTHCNLSPVSLALTHDLIDFLRQRENTATLAPYPLRDVGYLFVFGVGLGGHLFELLRETPARHVVLIEPVAELLLHSLAATDWSRLIALADRRDIKLHFILEDTPEKICQQVEHLVSRLGNVFLDGSYFFQHYIYSTFRHTMLMLRERLKNYYITAGFFEDEIEMIRNCHANLRRWDMRFIEPRLRREQAWPVILVGAGPSLDADLPHLKALQERAIIVSCGTSIGILLKNGIRPDFHCEIERGELVYTLLSKVCAEHGFEGITLIASTTVDPRVPSLFERRWFFVRGGLSALPVLTPQIRELPHVDPLCCNAAFASMAALGFRNIWLFGLDLAQKEEGRHHATDSVYYQPENKDWDDIYRRRFDRVVPGNFGGEVRTFWAFDSGRHGIAAACRFFGVTLVNCSDGARIDGARPRVASSVHLPAPAVPKSQVVLRLEETLRRTAAGELLQQVDLQAHVDSADVHLRVVEDVIEEWLRTTDSYFELERRLVDEMCSRLDAYSGYHAMLRGSLMSMLRLGSFFGSRIADEQLRMAFRVQFADAFRRQCWSMREETCAFLLALDDEGEDGDFGVRDAPLAVAG